MRQPFCFSTSKIGTKFPKCPLFWSMLIRSVILLFFSFSAFGQTAAVHWADSVLSRMSQEDKVRQIFLMTASPDQINPVTGTIDHVKAFRPGGVLIRSGTPASVKKMIARLQSGSTVPLLAAIQAEWGISQTLDSIKPLPAPAILGASSDSLAFITGRLVAQQMRSIGAGLNIGPNVDGDVPKSSVFYRYFSDDRRILYSRASAYIQGIQQDGAISVLKHIPGTVDGNEFTGKSLLNSARVDSLSFYPFSALLKNGAGGINTAWLHYSIPKKNKMIPAGISREFITEVLHSGYGYRGLTMTEVSFLKNFSPKRRGEAEKLGFMAGHDLLISPLNPDVALRKILKLVRRNTQYENQLNASVKRILLAKYRTGTFLKKNQVMSEELKMESLSNLLDFSAHAQAVTIVRNNRNLIPIKNLENRRFIHLEFRGTSPDLHKSLNRYVPFQKVSVNTIADTTGLRVIQSDDIVVASLSEGSGSLWKSILPWLKKLEKRCKLIIVHSGNPYDLTEFSEFSTLAEGYLSKGTDKAVPQILFGALPAIGSLPFKFSNGLIEPVRTGTVSRLSYAVPEAAEMDAQVLNEIEAIAREAIDSGATPGCRVLIARKGMVVFDRSYGWHTYDKKMPVTDESIYDLASVTKVSATLQTTMRLYDLGLIDLQKKLSFYLPELQNSNKKDFTLKDILTHQSGLWPYIPFWTRTVKDGNPMPEYYSSERSAAYPFVVSDGLYAQAGIRDSIRTWIINARIADKKDRLPFDYRYSDMGFYMLQYLTESIIGQPMETFLDTFLYKPLGAATTGFLPLNNFPSEIIAPTEDDKSFRKSLLTGYVHDQGSAMHGGVAGHAGLFSNANDMAKLGQMWLQEGYYGGKYFFSPETIRLFTARQYQPSRRGLGWDKPWPEDPKSTPTGMLASPETFGHTGFTGTCIWVDPKYDLVYVFLSNRVHPDMTNGKLINLNIRTRIHDIAYKSIQAFQSLNP